MSENTTSTTTTELKHVPASELINDMQMFNEVAGEGAKVVIVVPTVTGGDDMIAVPISGIALTKDRKSIHLQAAAGIDMLAMRMLLGG